jgi:Fe-S cluster assembly protein SufD
MTALARKLDTKTDVFQDDYARNGAQLPGAGLAWLDAKRRAAMDAFAKTGVPSRRVEAWKYTDLANAMESELTPAPPFRGEIGKESPFHHSGPELLLAGGFLHRAVSADGIESFDLARLGGETPDWVRANLGNLASGAEQPLGAASLALMRGGVAIRVRKPATLHLSFVNPPLGYAVVSHARVLLVVENGVSLRLLESHTGEGADETLRNLGMELLLKPQARVEHIRLQAEPSNTLHVTSIGALLERGAEYRGLYTAVGSRLSRLDINVCLAEPDSRATLHNVTAVNSGIADITTVMDHASPHTTSRQLFKSVAGGRGRAVNQGRVLVRKGAIKSDSHQLFKALLLSPRAEADAKPELEIFADDVVCGHGTAIGALDADALFYLRARGVPEKEAQGLLIRAFLEDAMTGFAEEEDRDALWRYLDGALASAGQSGT